ncbi:MAG TPA: sugar ABC transporter permease [Candidatus Krumholzibacteria bacterium]|nr:sugar ABC transporter permease [Candidatus Krumholzibacteria bacterium]
MNRRAAIALFLVPSALVMGLIVVWPFIYNLWLSTTNLGLYTIKHGPDFVGLAQYIRLFGEPDLYNYLLRTLIWTGVNVVFHVVLGVGFALLLNKPFQGRAIYRGLLILPWALPQYIAALSWRGMFNYEYGQINLMLSKIGVGAVPWLSTEVGAFSAALITNIWLGFPFMMVVALGGLQSIPKEMYEAADIDGAGNWWRFRHITVPLLRPVMMPAVVLGTIWTFNNLNVIWLVTNHGEPADSSHILVTYVYKAAFVYYRYGYAAAFGVLIFLILLLLTWVNYRQSDKPAYT